ENVLLRDQILYPGDRITLNREYIKINDTYVQPISVKNYPKHASLAMMAYLIGDPGGISNQITVPWMMTTGIHFPNQRSKSAAVRNKAQTITYQAYGPLLRFIPRLAYKKHGFDVLLHSMEDGDVLVEVAFNLVLFGKSAKELEKVTSALRTYYAIHQMDVAPERYICWPVFWNTLPLFPSCESIANLSRYRTMGVRHASQLLPILGEWRGTGTGAASIFVSRRGQPILFDFYDSPTSYNGVIVAESGAGKSFLTQQFIVDYLGCGARVWVIDVGRSYEKLAGVLQGEFIEFSERSQICLNPFSLVKDIDDDTDLLRELIAKMAAPNGLDDYRLARTEEAIRAVWAHLGPTMTVTDIYEYLLGQHDDRLRDLGNMLYPWTKYGSYGQWFNGQNNLNFDNAMTVLELEELKPRKQLQQVVLLQLIARIQQEMYLSGTDQPKILIVDEAWDLLDDPGVAKFMEHGYRRFRKYNGAAIIVTQSINDLYSSVNGRAIAENSPHLLILQQRSEAIESVEHEGKIKMEPYAFRVMKELHTVKGQYSEILFHTGRGWGVGRLVVDRFTQVLYSTSGPERTEILRAIHRGVPAIEAITDFLAQNKDTEG
ncbi:conjugal transfer ATP-binding protein TraC, partial [Desulfacinum hydrothermale DSM 13146]